MTCSACEIAEENPRTGRFNADCFECQCRSLAHSQNAKDAMMGYPEGLKAAMLKLFPDKDKYRAARVSVYGWIKRLS